MKRAFAPLLLLLATTACNGSPPAPAPAITEFALPEGSAPTGITAGPDGAMWVTLTDASAIARVTAEGEITVWPLPDRRGKPPAIIAAGDGALWFSESAVDRIGRIATDGTITEFSLPTKGSQPDGLAADGAVVWVALPGTSKLARITGELVEEIGVAPAKAGVYSVATGSNGEVWFIEANLDRIGRRAADGTVREYSLMPQGNLFWIAAGAPGEFWFTENRAGRVGRILASGEIEVWAASGSDAQPFGIAAAGDGSVWFTEFSSGRIGRIADGRVDTFALPTADAGPAGIARGPGQTMWYAASRAARVGRIDLGD